MDKLLKGRSSLFGDLVRMPPGRLPGALQARPAGRSAGADPGHAGGILIYRYKFWLYSVLLQVISFI